MAGWAGRPAGTMRIIVSSQVKKRWVEISTNVEHFAWRGSVALGGIYCTLGPNSVKMNLEGLLGQIQPLQNDQSLNFKICSLVELTALLRFLPIQR